MHWKPPLSGNETTLSSMCLFSVFERVRNQNAKKAWKALYKGIQNNITRNVFYRFLCTETLKPMQNTLYGEAK